MGKELFTELELPTGASAFEIAQAEGFTGTEAEWLASLHGQDGTDGADGVDGGQGEPGADAYEVAVENGYTGTRTQWLASLVGAPGADPTPQSYADALTANGPARNAAAGIAEQVVVDARTDVVEWQGGVEYAPGKRVVRLGRLWERKTTGSSSSFVPADWRYIGRVAGGWGNTAVLLGNSRFALERTPDGIGIGSAQQRGAMYWANLFLGQRLNIVNYAGVSGDTLDGMAARWATAVAAYVPDMVFLRDAVNDITNNASLSTVQSRYLALFALNRSIGARTIVFTTNPRNANDATRNAVIANVNRWLQSQTASDLLVVDVTTPIMATASAQWGTNFATDGLHQSRRGAAREGRRVAKALDSIIPPRPVLATIPSDTETNLIVNSYCAGTVGNGIPSSYSVSPSQGTGVTYSMVAPADQTPGNWFQSDTGTTAAAVYISQKQPIGTWVTPGSSYVRGVVEMESSAWTATLGGQGDVGVRVYLQCLDAANQPISFRSAGEYYYGSQVGDSGDATAYPLENQPGTDRPVVFETIPLLVPVGTTQISLLTHSSVAGKVRWRGFAVLKA